MKLVFTADLHLDSKFTGENGDIRRAETVKVFESIAYHAANVGASAVLIGGDLFDTPYPSPETEGAVRSIIEKHGDLPFIAVCGNHDPLYKTAFYKNPPQNMTVFGGDISKTTVDGIDIYGVSVKTAADTVDPWQGFHADGEFITLSHGDLDGNGAFRISSNALADSGGAIHLLGHIHKTSATVLSSGKTALYCGCPAGRGFDECGQRGFYEIDTDGYLFTYITTDAKTYTEIEVDISDITDNTELLDRLSRVYVRDNEIARAILVGATSQPIDINVSKLLPYTPQFVEIKDKSTVDIDVMKNVDSDTLEGRFIRRLSKMLEKATADEKTLILDALKEGVLSLRGQK